MGYFDKLQTLKMHLSLIWLILNGMFVKMKLV